MIKTSRKVNGGNNIIKDIKNLENNYSQACDEVCKLLNISSKESITEVLNERKADLNKNMRKIGQVLKF